MGKNKFRVPLLAPWFSKRGPIKSAQTKGDLEWKSSSLPPRTLSHDRAGMPSLWSHGEAVCVWCWYGKREREKCNPLFCRSRIPLRGHSLNAQMCDVKRRPLEIHAGFVQCTKFSISKHRSIVNLF